MANVRVMKRGKVYQYQFEIAPVDGKRKYINKSGFKTKKEAPIFRLTLHFRKARCNDDAQIYFTSTIK